MARRFEICPRSDQAGNGYKVTLFQDGIEYGGSVIHPSVYRTEAADDVLSEYLAYMDAWKKARDWLGSESLHRRALHIAVKGCQCPVSWPKKKEHETGCCQMTMSALMIQHPLRAPYQSQGQLTIDLKSAFILPSNRDNDSPLKKIGTFEPRSR